MTYNKPVIPNMYVVHFHKGRVIATTQGLCESHANSLCNTLNHTADSDTVYKVMSPSEIYKIEEKYLARSIGSMIQ